MVRVGWASQASSKWLESTRKGDWLRALLWLGMELEKEVPCIVWISCLCQRREHPGFLISFGSEVRHKGKRRKAVSSQTTKIESDSLPKDLDLDKWMNGSAISGDKEIWRRSHIGRSWGVKCSAVCLSCLRCLFITYPILSLCSHFLTLFPSICYK